MQFAYDDNKLRIRPSYSGQRAKCPLCEGTLIGKCGQIYVRHWQHHHDRECDPWKEHETDWHREWKAEFPDDWQEVIIENYGMKHIADIKTPEGVVIEFQNSAISPSTIRIREEFYGNMIWVVNAKTFKNNFQYRSVVTSRLRKIEHNASCELYSIEKSYDEDLKGISDEIEKNKKISSEKLNGIISKKWIVEKLQEILNKHDEFPDTVVNKWMQDESHWDYDTNDVTNKVESKDKIQLKEIPKAIEKLLAEIKAEHELLQKVELLENFQIDGKQFKIASYKQIPSTSFKKVRAISKQSRASFFPEIAIINSESEFHNYKYHKEHFDFAVDASETINLLNSKIEEDRKAILELEKLLPPLKQKIKDVIIQELKNKIQTLKNEMEQLDNEWAELVKKDSRLIERQARIEEHKKQEIRECKIEIEKKKNEQRFKIMREQKGLYTFTWKHERKSWQAANEPIFFDIGESYLFEKIKDGVFKKTMIDEFLGKHLEYSKKV